jgi:hypothetical protein
MGIINVIDHAMKNAIYSAFWWFLDPLEHERLYGQLVDVIERNLDATDPDRLVAPDNIDVSVNNSVFIKHAHSIKKLENRLRDRLQKYIANKDYELEQAKIKIQIISSSTVSKRKAQIRCWFSSGEEESQHAAGEKKIQLRVVAGDGMGMSWDISPGRTYRIGRLSSLDICLPYSHVSKKQATLEFLPEERIRLVDEGSANGTFINDEKEPVRGSREITISDKIRLCKVNPITLTISKE